MPTITGCLWFDGTAEEAARFYVSLLPDSHVDAIHHAPGDTRRTAPAACSRWSSP